MHDEALGANSLSIADLGYFSLPRFVARREMGSYTLSRLQAGTALFTPEGEALCLELVLVLLRERWQMELLYKLWKQHAQVDEWHTRDHWRKVCELYAKLLAVTLQHWLDPHGGVGWLSLLTLGHAAHPATHAVRLADEHAQETSQFSTIAGKGGGRMGLKLVRIGRALAAPPGAG